MYQLINDRYPEEDDPETLLDVCDLGEHDFLVACFEDKSEMKYQIFIWKGTSFNIDQDEYTDYINKVKRHFYEPSDIELVSLTEETPFSESDDFLNLL